MEGEENYYRVKAKKAVIATGAQERMIPFPNNDLPGVYGAGAVQTLMNVYGVVPGKRVLMVGAGNIGLIVSYQLAQARRYAGSASPSCFSTQSPKRSATGCSRAR